METKISLLEKLFQKGQSYSLPSNKALPLHEAKGVIYIEEGQIDLFGVRKNRSGHSIFISSFEKGHLIFPFQTHDEMEYTIELNTLKDSKIQIIPLEDFRKSLQDSKVQDAVIQELVLWVQKLSSISKMQIRSLMHSIWGMTKALDLEKKQTVKVGQSLAVREKAPLYLLKVNSGKVYLNWNESLLIDPESFPVPFPEDSSITAIEKANITFVPVQDLIQKSDFWAGLDYFHKICLGDIKHEEEQRNYFEQLQNERNLQLEGEVSEDAEYTLASVLSPTTKYSSIADEDLILACLQVIGTHLDIKIRSSPTYVKHDKTGYYIRELCEASQVRYREVVLDEKDWSKDGGPILAFYQDGTPVALIPESPTSYFLIDPRTREKKKVDQKVFMELKVDAYILYKSMPDSPIGMKLFRYCIEGHFRDIFTVISAGIIGAFLALYLPVSMTWVFDKVVPDKSYVLLYQICLGFLFVGFGSAIFTFSKSFAILRLEGLVGNKLQSGVWDRLLKLSMGFFRKHTSGDLYQRASAIDEMRQTLSGGTIVALLSSFFSILYLIVMFYRSWKLALIVLVPVILGISIYTIGMFMTINREFKVFTMKGKIYTFLVEIINGISKLRVSGAENRVHMKWAKFFSEKKTVELQVARIHVWLLVLKGITISFATICLYFFMIKFIKDASTTHDSPMKVGEFLSFLTAYSSFAAAMFSFALGITTIFGHMIPLWRRAKPILKEPPEMHEKREKPSTLSGTISLEHIDFRYKEDAPKILDDISIEIKAGKFIAICGSSGCGKSTLVKLLLGFVDPEKGKIYYDGKSLETLDVTELRKQIGVVLQNGAILGGTIRDNITCHRDYSDEQIMEILKLCNMEEDIKSLPMGLDSFLPIGGGTLSGGQQQRLMIARALIGHPRILIFDEATSALDNQTQDLIRRNLDNLNVTRIVIAHRLSTIVNADQIYVLNKGKIEQSGTFKELEKQGGFFQTLIKRQMQ